MVAVQKKKSKKLVMFSGITKEFPGGILGGIEKAYPDGKCNKSKRR